MKKCIQMLSILTLECYQPIFSWSLGNSWTASIMADMTSCVEGNVPFLNERESNYITITIFCGVEGFNRPTNSETIYY